MRWLTRLMVLATACSMLLVTGCDEAPDGKVTDTEIAIWIHNTTKSDTYFLWAATGATPNSQPPGSVTPSNHSTSRVRVKVTDAKGGPAPSDLKGQVMADSVKLYARLGDKGELKTFELPLPKIQPAAQQFTWDGSRMAPYQQ